MRRDGQQEEEGKEEEEKVVAIEVEKDEKEEVVDTLVWIVYTPLPLFKQRRISRKLEGTRMGHSRMGW